MAETGAVPLLDARVEECGDSGLLVTFAGAEAADRREAARRLADHLEDVAPAGLVDVLASFDTVFVAFDPVRTDHAGMTGLVEAGLRSPGRARTPREVELEVAFGGEAGPDLDAVAEALGMTAADVVALVCEQPWTVRVLGSPLGAPLMDRADLPGRIPPVPRLTTPRTRLPANSLGLSGHQSIVYPFVSPGGWRLVGRVVDPVVVVGEEPRLAAGVLDRVRFRPAGGPS